MARNIPILAGIASIVSLLFIVMLYFNVLMPSTAGVGYKVTSDLTSGVDNSTTIGQATNELIATTTQSGNSVVATGGSFITTLLYVFLLIVFIGGIFAFMKFR